jgi:hypothetical protein
MNMPNSRGEGYVHQLIVEHPSEDCSEFCAAMSDDPFILVRQLYFDDDRHSGERVWIDRGDMILNCRHIGKVMPHYAPPVNAVTPTKIKGGSTLSLLTKGRGE